MARIGRGDNCGEDSTVISQVGEDIMSAGFSGWAMCLRRGQLTLFPSPNTTTLLPTRPLSNNIDEKVWAGGRTGHARGKYLGCACVAHAICGLSSSPTPVGQQTTGSSSGRGNSEGRWRGDRSRTFWRGRVDKWERCRSEHQWNIGNRRQGRRVPPCKRWHSQGRVGMKAAVGSG